jgi:epoxyqueuosine reductase
LSGSDIENLLDEAMQVSGFGFRAVPFGRALELEADLAARLAGGDLDPSFVRERLASFRFGPPESLVQARSLMIVSMPQPIVEAGFQWKGLEWKIPIPPTYDTAPDREVRRILTEILGSRGWKTLPVRVPEKLLAVRTGLMQYGRNNIAYLPGRGSGHRLAAFASDWPCPDGEWREPVLMERCGRCAACVDACPTGAIDRTRFLLHAEKCLTFHNERAVPIPETLAPAVHHCLFGCLRCQTVCPENGPKNMPRKPGLRLTREETEQLISEVPAEAIPDALRGKIEMLCAEEDFSLMRRNLRLLLGTGP